jgi:hypothetical protein
LFHAREPTSAIAGPVTGAALDSRALTTQLPALAVWPERTLRITSANYDEAFFGADAETTAVAPAVPEPASLLRFGTGLVGLRAWRKQRP